MVFLGVNFSRVKKRYLTPKLKKSRLTSADVENEKWISAAYGDLAATCNNMKIMWNCFDVQINI